MSDVLQKALRMANDTLDIVTAERDALREEVAALREVLRGLQWCGRLGDGSAWPRCPRCKGCPDLGPGFIYAKGTPPRGQHETRCPLAAALKGTP